MSTTGTPAVSNSVRSAASSGVFPQPPGPSTPVTRPAVGSDRTLASNASALLIPATAAGTTGVGLLSAGTIVIPPARSCRSRRQGHRPHLPRRSRSMSSIAAARLCPRAPPRPVWSARRWRPRRGAHRSGRDRCGRRGRGADRVAGLRLLGRIGIRRLGGGQRRTGEDQAGSSSDDPGRPQAVAAARPMTVPTTVRTVHSPGRGFVTDSRRYGCRQDGDDRFRLPPRPE